eukprot:CAMPEP_0183324892 /NCGR_PEP_ID=MMETSP0160_2-20130417/78275_1 /TAXON_ID=2839 ORGANISM="Odontella Sinensis, Strain Grunow 1884" /NCGR_SAMPLE_ID=MMETSP0160_2 /ASSEMBLY_ACC=CAM_ASM_000250 /LENGTH=76 /DNA_ID=CAMNT_0025492575 /DNA_START=32 /DNA_END=259 /DNA_ORIENTATION=+
MTVPSDAFAFRKKDLELLGQVSSIRILGQLMRTGRQGQVPPVEVREAGQFGSAVDVGFPGGAQAEVGPRADPAPPR